MMGVDGLGQVLDRLQFLVGGVGLQQNGLGLGNAIADGVPDISSVQPSVPLAI
jgi:hypothetical protein